jgi:hypothetical protein
MHLAGPLRALNDSVAGSQRSSSLTASSDGMEARAGRQGAAIASSACAQS